MNKINLGLSKAVKYLEKIVRGLIYLYILTIPFQSIGFRFMGLNIGVPEIVFLVLAPLAVINIIICKQNFWINKLDLFILGWLLAIILSGWHSGFDSIAITEIIKTAYLVMIFIILKIIISPHMASKIPKIIIFSSLIASITGIIGLALGYLNIDTTLSITRPFPYSIDNIIQAKGFTPSPNMLASIIMIGVLFHLQKLSMNQVSPKGINYLILFMLVFGFFLTFSKTIVCLIIGIILILYSNHKASLSSTWWFNTRIAIAALFIVYICGTHFIFVKKHQNSSPLKGDYIAGTSLIEMDNYSIYPSQYWSLKEISFEAINQSFPWGLGPGKFNGFAHELKKNDVYSTHVPYPAPHSTYFGTLAEIGLPGFIAFFGIIFFVIKFSRKILSNYAADQNMSTSLPTVFIVIGMEAISTDVMNFRHYWILLILLVSTFQNLKSTSSKSLNL